LKVSWRIRLVFNGLCFSAIRGSVGQAIGRRLSWLVIYFGHSAVRDGFA
jgi:hypothetical protein